MTVYPGLIDSETQLGLTEISAEPMTNDLVEMSDEIMPHMHTAEAFHAESALIPVARMNGITNAVIAPEGADTLPGQDSFIQLAGADATQMLLVRDLAMPLNFTGGQRRNESFASASYPQTRMGMAAQMRQAFTDAQGYAAKWEEASFEYHATRRRFDFPPEDDGLLARLHETVVACWRLFELRGYARVDCRVDLAGAVQMLEVNINPCLSPDAGFAAAAERAGLDFPAILRRVVADRGETPARLAPADLSLAISE